MRDVLFIFLHDMLLKQLVSDRDRDRQASRLATRDLDKCIVTVTVTMMTVTWPSGTWECALPSVGSALGCWVN